MAKTRNIRQDSRNAVAKAGTRTKANPSNSFHFWGGTGYEGTGGCRPGKTARDRRA